MRHNLQIIPIPAFKDNYIWLIHNHQQAVIVDPGDATPVQETLQRLQLDLTTILITHHHHDHIGGVVELQSAYPHARTYAPKREQYQFQHTPVSEGDTVNLAEFSLQLAVIDLPGHTLGHIAYYIERGSEGDVENLLFCGDTLFGAGCGRLFEGTPAQMYDSLQKLAALPQDTKVYCTHEYTMHNIEFAMTLESNNQQLVKRQQDTIKLRNLQQPSLPSTIGLELATNPFLRCTSPEIQSSVQLPNAPALQVFSTIREMRNHY
ncbi:MAG TPA: hydroxyacylglutathione hydrolase [Methylotenera sp.]|nr:hydroxyacylglutathione hydrolase [Methylotenera sp.]